MCTALMTTCEAEPKRYEESEGAQASRQWKFRHSESFVNGVGAELCIESGLICVIEIQSKLIVLCIGRACKA